MWVGERRQRGSHTSHVHTCQHKSGASRANALKVCGLNLGEMSLSVKAEKAKCSRNNENLPSWMFIMVDEQMSILALFIFCQKISCDNVAKGGFKWNLSGQFSEILATGMSCLSTQVLNTSC